MCTIKTEIKLFQTFEQAIPHFKAKFKKMKNSFEPFGTMANFWLTVRLPFSLPQLILGFVSAKATLLFSNVNFMKEEMDFCNKK